MATAHEIALELLQAFAPNVIRRITPLTYGAYAGLIGRDGAKDGLAIGQAMHAIGAVCIIKQVPVAPLFWVERADGEAKRVFLADELERKQVVDSGFYDTMFVVAREHVYTEEEFTSVERAFRRIVVDWPPFASPHWLWHQTFSVRPTGEILTYFQRAIKRYEELHARMVSERAARKKL